MQANLVKRFFKSILQVLSSRLVILATVFVALFCILIIRIFYLQIVNGESYLNDYLYSAERTIDIPSTRGIIYDRNGVELAYNELAYAVMISDDGSQNNTQLNQTIYHAIQIIEKNGDSLINDFSITLDADGEFIFTTSSDIKRLGFLRDIYGKRSIDELDTNGKTLSTSTAREAFEYLCSSKRYNILNELMVAKMTPEEKEKIQSQKVYTKEEALKILTVRYNLSTTSYRRYISITMASDVNEKTVTAIKENKAELPGVTIEKETVRKYTDSIYFSHLLGYTRKASQEDLEKLLESDPSYTINDIVGQEGLESSLELQLQGKKGSQTVYVDSQGKILDVAEVTEPVAGNNFYLTIDSELQKKVYDMFEAYLAGILLTKIVNRDVTITPTMSAGSRYISVKDVYYALLNNGIIDINHFTSQDATDLEKEVYQIFYQKLETILAQLKEELTKDNATIYSKLQEEYQIYMSYIYTVLEKAGVLISSKIDTHDKTYIAWRNDDAISLQEFLKYSISQSWIDTSKLDVETKYSDSEEVYTALISFIEEKLRNDSGFHKRIYKYMVKNYTITPTQICLLLFDQNVLEYKEEDYNSLRAGNAATAFEFIRQKIRNMEITPAQLALDPCSGSICITDVNTGDVLALIAYPSYDNNKLSGYIDADYWNSLANDETNAKPLYNRATMTTTAPGSTYKIITAITGLEEGVITPNETIRTIGYFDKIPPKVNCWIYPGSHGIQNVTQAIQNSCNGFFCEVGYRLSLNKEGTYTPDLGLSKLFKYAEMFGLNERSGIELSEAAPHISSEYPITSVIGQGNNDFTNVQLSRYVSTIANGGKNYELTLLEKRTDSNDMVLEIYEPKVTRTVEIQESTWNIIHEGMRRVITNGSVKQIFRTLPISIAGKTGTAQENPMRPNHAVFMAYGPYENPEISVSVLIPNGFTSSYAAYVARETFMIYYNMGLEEYNSALLPGSEIVRD